jgi:hypothetical protein
MRKAIFWASFLRIASLRYRVPWLLVGLGGALLAADFVAWFEAKLQYKIMLAFFIPDIVYLADAVGTQGLSLALAGKPGSDFVVVFRGNGLVMEPCYSVTVACPATLCFSPLHGSRRDPFFCPRPERWSARVPVGFSRQP